MIPKIIHYCWLSNDPYPEDISRCIDSWHKFLPDYEFIKWDFNRIDKSKFKWVSDAFDHKKYAFAADYVRCYAIYKYGGIYLDTDVEVLKSFNDLLSHHYFMGCEFNKTSPEAAVVGAEKGHPFYRDMLKYYEERNFVKDDGSLDVKVLPLIINDIINRGNFNVVQIERPEEIDDADDRKLCILPYYYFSPKSTLNGKIYKRSETYAIHHFANSWFPKYYIIERKFWHKLGLKNLKIILRLLNLIKYGKPKGSLLG